MSVQLWELPEDLLMLYEIDPSAPGARDFCDLVSLSAEVLRFPELGCGTWAVAKQFIRERRWSPLVYWSRIKKAVRPLLEAAPDTLAALGLTIDGDKQMTAYALAHAVAVSIAQRYEGDYVTALQVARLIRGGDLND